MDNSQPSFNQNPNINGTPLGNDVPVSAPAPAPTPTPTDSFPPAPAPTDAGVPQAKKKSGKGLIIIIVVILLLIGVGVALFFILGNKNDGSNASEDKAGNSAEESKEFAYAFNKISNSTDENNITLTFYATEEEYYNLKLNGAGYGKTLTEKSATINSVIDQNKNKKVLSNDGVNIFRFHDGCYLYNFAGSELVSFILREHSRVKLSGSSTSYGTTDTYTTLKKNENIYLVKRVSSYSGGTSTHYYAYILLGDYDIEISTNDADKIDGAQKVYDYLIKNAETSYMTINYADYTVKNVTKSKSDATKVDISNWTFANDLIQDYYKDKYGFYYKDSLAMYGFNKSNKELEFDTPIKNYDEYNHATSIVSTGINMENVMKEKEKNEPGVTFEKINLNDYKTVYVKYDFYNTTVYITTSKDKNLSVSFGFGTLRSKPDDINAAIKHILNVSK